MKPIGIKLVDDPTGEHSELLPEAVSPEELAARSQTGYLLRRVPEGFTLEISVPLRQGAGRPFIGQWQPGRYPDMALRSRADVSRCSRRAA